MELFGIGPSELLLILFVALIVFGPGKLQEIAKGLGKAVHSFRKASSEFNRTMTIELEKAKAEQEQKSSREGNTPVVSHLPPTDAKPVVENAEKSTDKTTVSSVKNQVGGA